MSKVGRNEPCPCNSGKKYKHCHWDAERSALSESTRAMRLHDMDRGLVERLLKFASVALGKDWFKEILAELDDLEVDESMAQLIFTCSVYEWAVEEGTVVEIFLRSRPPGLSESEQAWLEAQTRGWLSIWEIQEVTPGVGVTVRDLFSGEERRVLEQGGSRSLKPRDAILARVVDFEGMTVFCGMHPRSLPPREAASVIVALRKSLGVGTRKVPVSRLQAEVPLQGWIITWGLGVAHYDASRLKIPELQNTDGDPLLLTTDRFEFDPKDRATIEAKLATLAEGEGAGSSAERAFSFQRSGNAMHKDWDNTVVGRAVLRPRALLLETNSIRRADDLRAKVEAALGALLRHRTREHQDPEALLKMARDPGRKPAVMKKTEEQPPEVLEVLRDFKRKHFATWLDTPLPALSGLTPREAAAKPRKRKDVVLLLKEMENSESRLPSAERFDMSSLWSELHLQGTAR